MAFITTTTMALVNATTTITLQNVLMRPAARLCWLNSGIKTNFLQRMQQFNFPHI